MCVTFLVDGRSAHFSGLAVEKESRRLYRNRCNSLNERHMPRVRRTDPSPAPLTLAELSQQIIRCDRCPRLRRYCQLVAREKRSAYRDWDYWGRPVPGFGDPGARVLILGLAPAAHGANRTGRVFTGDGIGGSGDFLMAALNRAGYANIPTSRHPGDGLSLRDAYIAAAVRCAPPGNAPTPVEIATCLDHLDAEVRLLRHVRVAVALGRIAWDAWLQLLARHAEVPRPKPAFGHGAVFRPVPLHQASGSPAARALRRCTLVGCYHPSRQNTNTGKVTSAMYDEIFEHVSALARREHVES
jgi:uracil-DNA glycosylase family 4